MKGKVKGGYYRYSYSGDLVDEHTHWGLGNAVFATKALYTIGALDEVDGKKEKKKLAEFITSFQRPDGCIYDPLVARGRLLNSIKHAVRTLDFSNIRSVKTIRAETRQAMSSLRLLGAKPQYMFSEIPYTSEGIERYLVALNWCDPWSAGSHFSHLLFFYDYNASVFSYRQAESQQLIGKAIDYVNKMQSNKEGVWYQGMSTSLQHKINGAMKILTGLKATGQMNFLYPDRMIDLALSAVNDGQACDNFNIVFVLKNANEMTGGSHRLNEIQDFCKRRLEIYREYYHSDIGGFSFYRGHSNTTYYGARITRGLNEPDVHGTCLFLWGIALIIQILGVQEQFKFNEFIA
jgi:hypothetical protein